MSFHDKIRTASTATLRIERAAAARKLIAARAAGKRFMIAQHEGSIMYIDRELTARATR